MRSKYNPSVNIGAPNSIMRQRQVVVYKVLNMLHNDGVDADLASPNYVADYAFNRGIELTSDMVVECSNKYEG